MKTIYCNILITSEATDNNTTPPVVNNPVSVVASTPSYPIQLQLDHHALMKQVSILNKQLMLQLKMIF